MPNNNLTDAEIIKALEDIIKHLDFTQIKSGENVLANALDLINRLQADCDNYKQIAEHQQSVTMDRGFEIKRLKEEIESLQAENERLYKTLDFRAKKITELEQEIERLNNCVKSEDEVREIAKRTMEPLVREITREQIDTAVKLAKAEAYKECIEKVKENTIINISGQMHYVIVETYFDNLLKELVGEENASKY